jgi:hypothetical protein
LAGFQKLVKSEAGTMRELAARQQTACQQFGLPQCERSKPRSFVYLTQLHHLAMK